MDIIIKNNGNVSFAKTTEQVYDYLTPANQTESKPNVEIGVPSTKMNQTTHYKVVDTASSTYDANRSTSDTTTQVTNQRVMKLNLLHLLKQVFKVKTIQLLTHVHLRGMFCITRLILQQCLVN